MNEQNTNQKRGQLEQLPVTDIVPSGDNPRIINEKDPAFVELIESIRAQGVIVPIHVRIHPDQKKRFELLAGERRLRASIKADKPLIPAINHGEISDAEAFEITFAENFAREDLTPIEQGKAVVTLLEKYKGDAEAAASKMGKSIKWIKQREALGTKLSKEWKKALVSDSLVSNWTAGHLQLVARLPEKMQNEILDYYLGEDIPTIVVLDKHIAKEMQLIRKAPFDIQKSGCVKCKKRTSCQPGLFDDHLNPEELKKNDRCLDSSCWDEKTNAWLKDEFESKKKELPNLVAITTEYTNYHQDRKFQQIWGKFLEKQHFTQAAKKDKGAMPGFIIFGKALGTILWIKLRISSSGGSTEKSTGKSTPLKQRRLLLDAKRWSQVLVELRTKVEETKVSQLSCKDKVISLIAHVSIYGNESLWSSNTETCQKEIKRLCEHHGKNPTIDHPEALVSLWNSFKPTLDNLLTYTGPVTQTPKHFIDDARWIAKLISVDISKIFEDVSKQKGFTEPKSWANLNADGTPKKAKKAKKKTAKKSAKTKQKKGDKKNAKS